LFVKLSNFAYSFISLIFLVLAMLFDHSTIFST